MTKKKKKKIIKIIVDVYRKICYIFRGFVHVELASAAIDGCILNLMNVIKNLL